MDLKGKTALVTGASAGIGAATVDALLAAGAARVFAAARRADRLKTMCADWTAAHAGEAVPLVLDVADRGAVARAVQEHPDAFAVDVLVNNAGLARGVDAMPDADLDDWDAMIRTNVNGLLYVTRHVVPGMIERGDGHVINLGSVAGRWVYPGGGVYCATKHAVRALSEGLRLDAQGTGLRVTNIEPGLVETEFSEVRFSGDKERAAKVYAGTRPLTPRDVAETIVWCVARPAHVNVQELVLYPTDQAAVRDVVRR